ncbi:saccharopine dehydrogenase family protein [Paenibacillus sanguinis]|uniref:saccharopine dehydrogenase family protein n=1 Tax=Paenibacillus sanguinis TaxID=225906 RepID=UPI000381147D|nr:saccharopine dehydrogenase NADP-binding domain-containing protein [Paenibacillus sanguinis]
MKDQIIVIGGYGQVGQVISSMLGELFPGKVYAAGRSLERAQKFSQSTGGRVQPMQFDARCPSDSSLLEQARLVVMCLDQADTRFVQSCLESGTHYVDISADYSFLAQVEQCHPHALSGGATAVLSVGLAPGLTHLLAHHVHSLLDSTDSIDISILLGLGDQHGQAAIEWTIDNMNADYLVLEEGKPVEASSFTDGKKISFGREAAPRMAYRFNFSDQHVLPVTLGVPTVVTRLCLDSAAITRLLAGLKAAGMLRWLNLSPIRRAAIWLLGKPYLGKARYAVKVDARGTYREQPALAEGFLQGEHEAWITAKMAAIISEALYRSELSHGVYHIEQLFELKHVLAALGKEIQVEIGVS